MTISDTIFGSQDRVYMFFDFLVPKIVDGEFYDYSASVIDKNFTHELRGRNHKIPSPQLLEL